MATLRQMLGGWGVSQRNVGKVGGQRSHVLIERGGCLVVVVVGGGGGGVRKMALVSTPPNDLDL